MSYIYPNSDQKVNSYKLYFVYNKEKIYLGSYATYEKAQEMLSEAEALMQIPDHTIPDFNKYKMDYKKVISLCNFRDNKRFIKNPIYIYSNYFHYYLSKDCILTFDVKDLFYFSTYKIRKRGNYLYTQDSVSQKSILSRFGILNHSVLGKDYYFKNNDPYDFRKENLEIINTYKGVTKKEKADGDIYIANIYIDSNLIIGYYNTEIEAAIAYNKAIDLIIDHTPNKTYTPNLIPYLTKDEYQNIYNNLTVSPRLLHMDHHRKRVTSIKKYRGISKDKNSFKVHIGYNGKQYYLGMYPTEKRAAQAYNYASFYLFGRSGYVNNISPLVDDRDTEKIVSFLSKYGILKETS